MGTRKRYKFKKRFFIIIVVVFVIAFRGPLLRTFSFTENILSFVDEKLYGVKQSIYSRSKNFRDKINDIVFIDDFLTDYKLQNIELQMLKLKALNTEQIEQENNRLRELLNLKGKIRADYEVASVKLVENLDSNEKVYIDKGSDYGLQKGMPVFTEGRLIGRIEDVKNDYSSVALLTNKNSKISVIVNNKELAILRGNGSTELVIEHYNGDLSFDSFDNASGTIQTSGISDILPGGLYIGKFNIKDKEKFLKTKEIRINRLFNIYEVSEVVVAKYTEDDLSRKITTEILSEIKDNEKNEETKTEGEITTEENNN